MTRNLAHEPALFAETIQAFFAPIQDLLADARVNEVMINGPDTIYVERAGRLERTEARFESVEHLLGALRNLAQYLGRRLEDDTVLEGRFPDGSRVEAVMRPACHDGPCVAIRRFSRELLTMERLVSLGAITPGAVELLRALVEHKQNVLVAGGTASGKTSLLNALAGLCPAGDRVVVIEDARELQLQLPHVVQLEAQPPDVDGRGGITIRRLFQATLRLRPDRIVVGEIRGGEALDLLQAMTSGHGGCMSTVHATHALDAVHRIETMAMMSDVSMPLPALRSQVVSAVDIVVGVARFRDGSRKITGIHEVVGLEPGGGYRLRALYTRGVGDKEKGGVGALLPTGELPSIAATMTALGTTLPSEMLAAAERGG